MSEPHAYEDFRDEIIGRYPNTVLIAEVTQPSSHSSRVYGPFADGEHATKWLLTVPIGVRVRFTPLRNPNTKRSYEDFYNPDKMLDLDKEFTQTTQVQQ